MRFLNSCVVYLKRQQKLKRLRKQLKMTGKCTRELNILLTMLGLELSGLKVCPVPAEIKNDF